MNSSAQINDIIQFFETPPKVENLNFISQAPQAPIKQKKRINRNNLKPRKLIYTDQEMDVDMNSGINGDNLSSMINNLSLNNKLIGKENLEKNHNKRSIRNTRLNSQLHVDRPIIQKRANKENSGSFIYKIDGGSKNRNNKLPKLQKTKSSDFKVYRINNLGLSQPTQTKWQYVLKWLQERRDVGLWIQCSRCKKWRFVDQYHDPTYVPKIWHCDMNKDENFAACEIQQDDLYETQKYDLIANKYNAGSIVWVHMENLPWWPGMVDDCPESKTYYITKKSSNIPIKYHVTFFDENKLERGWIKSKDIKSFIDHDKEKLVKKTVFHGINYKDRLNIAYKIALNAEKLSIKERLQKFSFLAQYDKLNLPHYFDSLDNNENNRNKKYIVGDTVWVKLIGFPWWPAMIDVCPETKFYYTTKKSSTIPIKYNVTYFDIEELEHDWVNVCKIKPFNDHDKDKLIRRTIFHGISYKDRLNEAYKLAQRAEKLNIVNRLENFSFRVRYEKLIPGKEFIHNDETSSDVESETSLVDIFKNLSSPNENNSQKILPRQDDETNVASETSLVDIFEGSTFPDEDNSLSFFREKNSRKISSECDTRNVNNVNIVQHSFETDTHSLFTNLSSLSNEIVPPSQSPIKSTEETFNLLGTSKRLRKFHNQISETLNNYTDPTIDDVIPSSQSPIMTTVEKFSLLKTAKRRRKSYNQIPNMSNNSIDSLAFGSLYKQTEFTHYHRKE